MKYKFALIGKNISHSLSPRVFRKILRHQDFQYDLLDFQGFPNEEKIRDLLIRYHFINVTSPFKKNASLCCDIKKTNYPQSINTLYLKNQKIIGLNTDAYGFEYLIKHYKLNLTKKISLFGDGLMSSLAQEMIKNKNVELFSRKQQNFDQIYRQKHEIILNTLSRSAPLQYEKIQTKVFLDLNYDILKSSLNYDYKDGLRFLITQAYHGLKLSGILS